jgi:hypothetical protein
MSATAARKQKLIIRALSAAVAATAVPAILFGAAGTAQADSFDDAVNNAQTQLNTFSDAYGKAVQAQAAAQHAVDVDAAELNLQKNLSGRKVNCYIDENPSLVPLDPSGCQGSDVAGAQARLHQAQANLNGANDRVTTLKAWVLAALQARNDAVAARDQAHNH